MSLRSSAMIAAALLVYDAFLLNQGGIALFTLISIVLIRLPLMAAAFYKKNGALLKNRAARALIYAAMAVLVLGLNYLNNWHADKQAEVLVAACKRYKEKHQKFPDKLEDLVPDFIQKVPRAKYVPGYFGEFNYWIDDEKRHWLEWTNLPPFGRPYYILEEGRWGYSG